MPIPASGHPLSPFPAPIQAGHRLSFAKGDEVFSQGEPAGFFYKVVCGAIRSGTLLSDARRQIDSFHFAGDIFGFEAACNYTFSAEAIEDTTVVAFRRRSFSEIVRECPALADQLMLATVRNLQRARTHTLLLTRLTAREKIAAFLLDIARRLKKEDRFVLPMQRADIADHLGLTPETVSRTLTDMARDGLIKRKSFANPIILQDKAALRRLRLA